MKVTELAINNFGAIGRAVFQLYDKGLVLIQGENLDDSSASSNGAGKSTIPDALCWCLFGVTARGDSGDKVVNRTAGKECYVSAHITDGKHTWSITRYRKHGVGKNRLTVSQIELSTGGVIDLTCGTDKDTQAAIENILGCTYEVFAASIYAGQEAMPNLPAMTDKQLKELIEEAAGITRLQRAHELAREDLRNAEKALDRYSSDCKNFELRVENATQALADMGAAETKWAMEHAQKIAGMVSEEIRLKNERQAIVDALALYPKNLDSERDRLAKQLDGFDGEKRELARLQKLATDAEKAVALKSADLARMANVMRENKDRYDHVDDLFGKPCPECNRPHTVEERDDLRKHLAKQLKAHAEHYKQAKLDLEALKAAAEVTLKAATSYELGMTDVSGVTAQLRTLTNLIGERTKEQKNLEHQDDLITQVAKQVMGLRATENPFKEQIAKGQANLETVKRQQQDHKDTGKTLAEQYELAKMAVEVFGPAGVRAHILDTVTPFLNTRTAEYLNHLSDGNLVAIWSTIGKTAKGELREKFNIEVSSASAGEAFSSLSGGEKRKVRLACALALQDLVASRATKPIELFIGDEIDHALDPAGLERLMGVLEIKAKERGTVLVISHGDLTDWIRQVTTVTKKGGYSTASGALVV